MSGFQPSEEPSLPPSVVEQIDEICDAFESAMQNGGKPTIEDHLGATPEPHRRVLFRHLLLSEIDYRQPGDNKPTPEQYLVRFPEYAGLIQAVFADGPETDLLPGASGGSSHTDSASTSTSLLARIRENDPAAWEQLVDLYAPWIYRWCRLGKLQAADAADVVQEVLKSVATGISGFRGGKTRGSFRAWLKVITHNKIHDYHRREHAQPVAQGGTGAQQSLLQVPEAAEPSDTSAEAHEASGLWFDGLAIVRAEFEDCTWQAFWRVAVDGQRPADVAADLEITTNAVYKAKCRVLRRLRQALSDLEESD